MSENQEIERDLASKRDRKMEMKVAEIKEREGGEEGERGENRGK